MTWKQYREANQQRKPRSLFLELMKHVKPALGELAIDLGCGGGVETREFLARGWNVLAIDSDAGGIEALGSAPGLQAQCRAFEGIETLPDCAIVFSAMSLPFCSRGGFPRLWGAIEKALVPKGWIAVDFFGPRDTWVESGKLIGHSSAEVQMLLAPFDVRWSQEVERDAPSVSGPLKHWHVHSVIAQKRAVLMRT